MNPGVAIFLCVKKVFCIRAWRIKSEDNTIFSQRVIECITAASSCEAPCSSFTLAWQRSWKAKRAKHRSHGACSSFAWIKCVRTFRPFQGASDKQASSLRDCARSELHLAAFAPQMHYQFEANHSHSASHECVLLIYFSFAWKNAFVFEGELLN